jgi:hypothetical protein
MIDGSLITDPVQSRVTPHGESTSAGASLNAGSHADGEGPSV